MLCHRHLILYLDKMRPDTITPKKIHETLIKIKNERNLAPRTVDYLRGYLHRFFEYARKIEEWVRENPVQKVERPKYNNCRTTILDISQQQVFLRNIDDKFIRDAVIFMLFTGLRLGELLKLKKEDFKSAGDFIYFSIQREKVPELTTEFPVVREIPRKIVENI